MTIRAPYIKPPFDIPAPISSQPLGSPSILLAVVVATVPFFNAQFNPVTPVRAANALVQPYNSNLYTNPIPFAQFQWPRVTPLGPSVPRQAVFNNELLLNPIPFNAPTTLGGSSLFFDAASSVSPLQAYNLNLYASTAPAPPFIPRQWGGSALPRISTPPLFLVNYVGMYSLPFTQLAWGGGTFIEFPPAPAQPYNNQLYTNPIPFAQYDWSKPQSVAPKAADVYQPYGNFYTTVIVAAPFYQSSWPAVQPIKPVVPQPTPYNAQIYTNLIPFAQYDWSKPQSVAPKATDVYQPYSNFYPFVSVTAPFYQNSWPSVSPIKPVVPQPTPYNAQLYTNPIPFAQYDWSKPVSIAPKASDVYQPYGNFYSVVVMPFAQYDWPKVQPVRAAPPQLISVNYYADFYSSPFSQTAWPQVARPAPSAPLPFNFNSPLYFVQPPFNMTYWPQVRPVRSSPPQPQPFNDLLYKNPLPFAQYYWPQVRTVKNAPPFTQPVVLSGPSVFFASNRIIDAGAESRVANAYAEIRVAVTFSENRVADAPKKDI
jgi:hypothetical protein